MQLEEGQKVNVKIIEETTLGFYVMINNEFEGLLYRSEVYRDIEIGYETQGYIKQLREDGKIDVVLRPQGFKNVIDSDVERILQKLKESHEGFLMLTDKSSPESIKFHLQISKKAFKKAVGNLYRKKLIILKEDRIELANL